MLREINALKAALATLRDSGGTIALVPTMGALHAGHMALVAEARRRARHVIVSIFVNPLQFGANEDLASYPRREANDGRMLEEAEVAILWAPSAATMYPDGFATTIRVADIGDQLEGAARPAHFDGVATVVAKLFAQVRPDLAVFGEKDYQQVAVIRRMVADLDLGIAVLTVPTQRDADGVALSSRNAYLTDAERVAARTLPRALGEAARMLQEGASAAEATGAACARLTAAGFDPIDYVALADAETLAPLDRLDHPARLLAAARLGSTRLIDNLALAPSQSARGEPVFRISSAQSPPV